MMELIDPDSTVLDIGCGDGGFLSYLRAHKEVRELGIDISAVAVEQCASRGLNVRNATLFDLRSECVCNERLFDFVVMVIEHVPNSEGFLRTAWELTGRRLIISFPNIAFWPHRLRLLLGRNPVQWVYFQAEHLRFWSLPDFLDWLVEMKLPGAHVRPEVVATTGTRLLQVDQRWQNLFGSHIVVVADKGLIVRRCLLMISFFIGGIPNIAMAPRLSH
jgi:methionine biosynthesis protein MetW